MTNNQILLGSLGLAYIDILAASHFAGQWQAAVFAGLSIPCVGIALIIAQKIVKPRE